VKLSEENNRVRRNNEDDS